MTPQAFSLGRLRDTLLGQPELKRTEHARPFEAYARNGTLQNNMICNKTSLEG